jgi:two-component system response regulator NreC
MFTEIPESLKIMVVDDHILIRKGLKALLNYYNKTWEIIEAGDGIQAMVNSTGQKPDIILMDYMMPKMDGEKAAIQILKDFPGVGIIMISAYIPVDIMRKLLHVGVLGILPKISEDRELIEAITSVSRGIQYVSKTLLIACGEEAILGKSEEEEFDSDGNPLLTKKEKEILQFLVRGTRRELIADKLMISPRTLDGHKQSIYRKLDIHSLAELVRIAYANNLV